MDVGETVAGRGDAPPSSSGKLAAFQGQSAHKGGRRARQPGILALLRLEGMWVRRVQFFADRVVVVVALGATGWSVRCASRRRTGTTSKRPGRPGSIPISASGGSSSTPDSVGSVPEHGVRVEAVPFAWHRSGFTRDFEALVAWLATTMDKSAITKLLRIDWDTVEIITRVCAEELDADRLENLFEIGINEVSWKRQHNYLTLVADHLRGRSSSIEGDGRAANRFFRSFAGTAPSDRGDLARHGPGYAKSAASTPQAIIATIHHVSPREPGAG